VKIPAAIVISGSEKGCGSAHLFHVKHCQPGKETSPGARQDRFRFRGFARHRPSLNPRFLVNQTLFLISFGKNSPKIRGHFVSRETFPRSLPPGLKQGSDLLFSPGNVSRETFPPVTAMEEALGATICFT